MLFVFLRLGGVGGGGDGGDGGEVVSVGNILYLSTHKTYHG